MCLIFLAVNQHPSYKLIVAANRDEFYTRKTAPAHFWKDFPDVLGGRDLEASGTWMGMNLNGKISMITNYRDPVNINSNAPSRGRLVSDYLINGDMPEDYLNRIATHADRYNGFNLLTGYPDHIWYLSNYGNGIQKLQRGIFGLSNHLLDTNWPKVKKGKEKFSNCISDPHFNTEMLFDLLYDEERAKDDQLPDTGIGLERERALSSMFIKTKGYGTRCSTVIMVTHDDQAFFAERVFDLDNFTHHTNHFEFSIKK